MKPIVYIATVRSRTSHGTDSIRIEHFGPTDPRAVAVATAADYGATLVTLEVQDPVDVLRKQLRECLGFVEAWQKHLAETEYATSAQTVQDVLDRARHVYSYSAPTQG